MEQRRAGAGFALWVLFAINAMNSTGCRARSA